MVSSDEKKRAKMIYDIIWKFSSMKIMSITLILYLLNKSNIVAKNWAESALEFPVKFNNLMFFLEQTAVTP